MLSALGNSGVSYGQMSNLCAEVMSGTKSMTKLTTLPMIKTRTKKVEAEEKAKRDRASQSENAGSSGSSSSNKGENDGTRDGRRAEREQRRDELREKSGAVPKTPEEIAEMERQRRIRMEDAERAWTVQDGDLPPEGEQVSDEGGWDDLDDDADESESAYILGDLASADKENDEDVLDLD